MSKFITLFNGKWKINPASIKSVWIIPLAFEETDKKQSKIEIEFIDNTKKEWYYGEDCVYDNKQFKLDVVGIKEVVDV
tara:strand:- start:124 stop:357 length:234 start_codon:yes stop_codon:yes gene_type:complete